jgi:hypothetical protein
MRVANTEVEPQEDVTGAYLVPVSVAPSTAGEIWAVMPLFILIMILSMVFKIVTALTKPEVLSEIAKGAVSGAIMRR